MLEITKKYKSLRKNVNFSIKSITDEDRKIRKD